MKWDRARNGLKKKKSVEGEEEEEEEEETNALVEPCFGYKPARLKSSGYNIFIYKHTNPVLLSPKTVAIPIVS